MAHALLAQAWHSGLAGKYRASVAKAFGVPENQLTFYQKETVRYRMEGRTPMIDLPRIETRRGTRVKSDQRGCVALCIDQSATAEYSSKIWARVGPPQFDLGCSLDDIRERTRIYRRQASICSEWFCDQFFSLTKELFGNNTSTNIGKLEVTTVGLRVEREPDEDSFDDWLLSNDGPNTDNDVLFRFLADAADLDIDLRDENVGPLFDWMSIPHTVELPNRNLASRQFVYFVRQARDARAMVGIGFDDSGRGELANDAALKMSRLIAHRI